MSSIILLWRHKPLYPTLSNIRGVPTPLTFHKGETVSIQLVNNWGSTETNLHNAFMETRTLSLNIISVRLLLLDQKPIGVLKLIYLECNFQIIGVLYGCYLGVRIYNGNFWGVKSLTHRIKAIAWIGLKFDGCGFGLISWTLGSRDRDGSAVDPPIPICRV